MFKSIFKAVGVAVVVSGFFCFGCGSDGGGSGKPSELVGHWIGVDTDGGGYYAKGKMELFKDGTGVSNDKSISWKVENKRFVILSSGKGLSCNYYVSNYTLYLFKDDGSFEGYIKKELWNILERAEEAKKNGKYDEAISGFNEAIKKDPNFAGAYNGLAGVYTLKKDYDKAIAKYDEAIRIIKRPLDIFGIYSARALMYVSIKEYDKAIADWELALQTVSSADYKDFGSTTLKEGIIEVIKEQIDILKRQRRSK